MFYREEVLPGVSVAFTDRANGNLALHTGDRESSVLAARRAVESELGTQGPLLFVSQIHSTRVVSAAQASLGPQEADAIVSEDGARALGILAADCLPVVLVGVREEPGAHPLTAVAHAGREGLLNGVLPNTVAALRAAGARQLRAWIGPSVCARCYEVPGQMAERAQELLPGILSRTSRGTTSLDLPGVARAQLSELGVSVHMDAHTCTLENQRLYSYRENKTIERHAGLVWTHPQ